MTYLFDSPDHAAADARDHELFLRHLAGSEKAKWVAAQWLSAQGFNVQVNTAPRAPTHADWKSYADHGDLQIAQRVEVKHLSRHFTCHDDWPFGDKFIVCAKHTFDRAVPKPWAYLIFNATFSHLAFVMAATSATWRVERRKDSRYEVVEQEYYFAPMERVQFRSL